MIMVVASRMSLPIGLHVKVEVLSFLPIVCRWSVCVCVCVCLCSSVGLLYLCESVKYLVFLLLLLAHVTAVGVVFDNFLAHVVHSVHQ